MREICSVGRVDVETPDLPVAKGSGKGAPPKNSHTVWKLTMSWALITRIVMWFEATYTVRKSRIAG